MNWKKLSIRILGQIGKNGQQKLFKYVTNQSLLKHVIIEIFWKVNNLLKSFIK
jgi:hypothetical protein